MSQSSNTPRVTPRRLSHLPRRDGNSRVHKAPPSSKATEEKRT